MKQIVLIIGATSKRRETPHAKLTDHLGVEAVQFIHQHLNRPVTAEQAKAMWDGMNEFNRTITMESYRLVKGARN